MNNQPPWQAKMRFSKRAPRFATDLHVEAKTFGSSYACDLIAINVSLTGLMVSGQADILPFQRNTLVELCIDPTAQHLPSPLICLGKVARLEQFKPDSHDLWIKKIGICITDIDEQLLLPWVRYVSDLEKVWGKEDDTDEDAADLATIVHKSLKTKPVYLGRHARFAVG